jgi:hypothetical protein
MLQGNAELLVSFSIAKYLTQEPSLIRTDLTPIMGTVYDEC